MLFEVMDSNEHKAVIKVIGVGGGGGNAVQHMVDVTIDGVEFICANTDAQALKNANVKTILQLGANVTKGLGAGANPEIGRQAAFEDRDRIQEAIQGADMLFITAGMGGGTGTGAAPVVAQIARELGILTVSVVTRPFPFEGNKRMQVAMAGIKELSQYVDSLITIPNEKLLTVLGTNVTLLDAFKAANDVLLNAVRGIAELITRPGVINVDFADVRTVMSSMGHAVMGTGRGAGENRAQDAANNAIQSPLLEDVNLNGAKGILVNVTGGMDMSVGEFNQVGKIIQQIAAEDATVVIGMAVEPEMHDEIKVTVVATGLGSQPLQQKEEKPKVRIVRGDDYRDFERPTVIRQQHKTTSSTTTTERSSSSAFTNHAVNSSGSTPSSSTSNNMDYLDIPAFLRRQAD